MSYHPQQPPFPGGTHAYRAAPAGQPATQVPLHGAPPPLPTATSDLGARLAVHEASLSDVLSSLVRGAAFVIGGLACMARGATLVFDGEIAMGFVVFAVAALFVLAPLGYLLAALKARVDLYEYGFTYSTWRTSGRVESRAIRHAEVQVSSSKYGSWRTVIVDADQRYVFRYLDRAEELTSFLGNLNAAPIVTQQPAGPGWRPPGMP